jgi:hypothetical protein
MQSDVTSLQQAFAPAGIEPMQRPSWLTRAFMAVVGLAERLNRRFSCAGNPPVYRDATFPWALALERQAPAMLPRDRT